MTVFILTCERDEHSLIVGVYATLAAAERAKKSGQKLLEKVSSTYCFFDITETELIGD